MRAKIAIVGGVTAQIDEDVVAFRHDLIGAQRYLAWRLHHLPRWDMECTHVHAALDDVALKHAVSQARRRVGTFVVSDVESAVDIVDRKPMGADVKRLHRTWRHL